MAPGLDLSAVRLAFSKRRAWNEYNNDLAAVQVSIKIRQPERIRGHVRDGPSMTVVRLFPSFILHLRSSIFHDEEQWILSWVFAIDVSLSDRELCILHQLQREPWLLIARVSVYIRRKDRNRRDPLGRLMELWRTIEGSSGARSRAHFVWADHFRRKLKKRNRKAVGHRQRHWNNRANNIVQELGSRERLFGLRCNELL